MAIELKQSMRLSQQLVMTPQLQQAIKLLQLSRLELTDLVQTEMLENPLLEETPETLASGEDFSEKAPGLGSEKEVRQEQNDTPMAEVEVRDKEFNAAEWENYFNEGSSHHQLPTTYEAPEDLPSFEATMSKAVSLQDHLVWQIKLSDFDEKEREVSEMIVGNIDDDGYFKSELEDLANRAGCTVDFAEDCLAKVQELDPPGVGARDLKECLLLQTRLLEGSPLLSLVRKVIKNHLDLLINRNFPALVKTLNTSMDRVKAIAKIIGELEPKPGRPFSTENPQYIVPDVYVYKVGSEYTVVLNEDGLPKLKISNFYQNSLGQKTDDGKAKEYIQGKIRSAVWLIRSIHQRQRTIFKTTESIVKFQREFFDHGISHLKPMVLRDVAEDISMHESTISRVTTNKYVHTPHGIFELKFFFNSSIARTNKESLASEAVKSKIKQLILSENPKKPFSDQEIVEMLGQSGIEIARRTVAKYREAMSLLPSSKRKRMF